MYIHTDTVELTTGVNASNFSILVPGAGVLGNVSVPILIPGAGVLGNPSSLLEDATICFIGSTSGLLPLSSIAKSTVLECSRAVR